MFIHHLKNLVTVVLIGAMATTASAQVFVGSDNFNDATLELDVAAGEQPGVWSYSTPNSAGTGGAFTQVGGKVEYTTSSTSGFNRGFLGWVDSAESYTPVGGAGLSAGNPYNSSWTAQVSVTNLLTAISSGYTMSGLEIYTNASTGPNAYYGIYVNTSTGSSNIQFEWGVWDGVSDYNRTTTYAVTGDTTDVVLRMSYEGATKVLGLDYSFDGSSFISGTSFDLDGAQAGLETPLNNGIGVDLLGLTNNIGVGVSAGEMTYDNFAVSAVPEPSTYAAIAGLGALGLAIWRKRRSKAV